MLSLHIEEDFGFTTREEVVRYTYEDRLQKPILPGYQCIQLLDQLDGQAICSSQDNDFRVLVIAHSGSAFWLAKHMSTNEYVNEINVCLTNEFNDLSKRKINALSKVTSTFFDTDVRSCDEHLRSMACVVFACWGKPLVRWFAAVEGSQRQHQKSILAYDPSRYLRKYYKGHYFMNSKIWVSGYGD